MQNAPSPPHQQGQSVLAFLVLFPVFLVCLVMVTDLGRLFYLKNQVRISADAAALAAAGAADMRRTSRGAVCQLNRAWAAARARQVLGESHTAVGEDAWMQLDLAGLQVRGCAVTVVVEGRGTPLFGAYVGLDQLQARAVAHARAIVQQP